MARRWCHGTRMEWPNCSWLWHFFERREEIVHFLYCEWHFNGSVYTVTRN
jgi:hypothetical protein